MPTIKVNTNTLHTYETDLQNIQGKIAAIMDQFDSVKNNLDWDIRASSGINSRLKGISRELSCEKDGIGGMKKFLNSARTKYDLLENQNQYQRMEIAAAVAGAVKGSSGMGKAKSKWNCGKMVVSWCRWLKEDFYGGFKTLQSWIEDIGEEYTFRKPKLLPDGVSKVLGIISTGDILIKTVKDLKKYIDEGDGWGAYEKIGSMIFSEVAKRGNAWMDKVDNLHYLGVDKTVQGILVSTIIKIPSKWLEGIKDFAENGTSDAGTIVYDTIFGSLVEATAGLAEPVYKAATGLSYPVIDQICECFGYDLSGMYERLTGKKGLDAVFDAQKQFWADIVYAEVRKKSAQGINGFYRGVSNGWKSWKSGMELILGR